MDTCAMATYTHKYTNTHAKCCVNKSAASWPAIASGALIHTWVGRKDGKEDAQEEDSPGAKIRRNGRTYQEE